MVYQLYNGDDNDNGDEVELNGVYLGQKVFEMAEKCGSEISYRYINCRNCKSCKEHDHAENISIPEEVEDDFIRKSVSVDIEKRI